MIILSSVVTILIYIGIFALFLILANLVDLHPNRKDYQILCYLPVIGFLLIFLAYGLTQENRWVGFAIGGPAFLALLVFIPFIRNITAQWLPIQTDRAVHTVSLALSSIIFIEMFSIIALGLDRVNQSTPKLSYHEALLQLWTQDILLIVLAFLGVGLATRRNLKETLQRLGLQKIGWSDLWLALGLSFGLALGSFGIEKLTLYLQWGVDPAAHQLTEKRLGPLDDTFIGLLSLGIGAGLGEEILFRGAIQPRFGILFTSILFAFTHTNYGLGSAMFILVLGGLYLGWIRSRYHTTMAIIVHALYNVIVILIDKLL